MKEHPRVWEIVEQLKKQEPVKKIQSTLGVSYSTVNRICNKYFTTIRVVKKLPDRLEEENSFFNLW